MKNALFLIIQIFIIWLIYFISGYIVDFFHLPVPGSVFGMVLLFLLLCTGIFKVSYIERASTFLNKHLAFFFIPFAVGLMKYGGLIKESGFQLLIMIVGSTVIGLVVTSGMSQMLSRKEGKKRGQSNSH